MQPLLGVPLATAPLALCMGVSSLVLQLAPLDSAGPAAGGDPLRALRFLHTTDQFAIQNLGHAAFLLLFATSWAISRNKMGLLMTQASGLLVLASLVRYLPLLGLSSPLLLVFVASALLCAVVSTSTGYDHQLAILHPRAYLSAPRNGTLRMRRVLLFQFCVAVADIALVFFPPASMGQQPATSVLLTAPLLRGLIESYTLAFHSAFVLGLGFSQALCRTDYERSGPVLRFFIFAEFFLLATSAIDAFLFSWRVPEGFEVVHAVGVIKVASILASMAAAVQEVKELSPRWQSPSSNARRAPPAAVTDEHDDDGQPLRDEAARQPWPGAGVQTSTHFSLVSLARMERTYAFPALLAAAVHGSMWIVQCVLLVVFEVVYFSARERYASWHVPASLEQSLNFSMHGTGIAVYVAFLSLFHPSSFGFFRVTVLAGALGGGASSVIAMSRILELEPSVPGQISLVFFGARAAAGLLLAVTYGMLRLPAYRAISPSPSTVAADDHLSVFLVPELQAYSRPATVVCLVYLGIVIYYAVVMAVWEEQAWDPSGGLFPSEWAQFRAGALPLSFMVLYHYGILQGGFALHALSGFAPSIYVARAFALGAALVSAAQVCALLLALDESARWAVTAALAFAVGNAAVFVVLGTVKVVEYSGQRVEGDIWM